MDAAPSPNSSTLLAQRGRTESQPGAPCHGREIPGALARTEGTPRSSAALSAFERAFLHF